MFSFLKFSTFNNFSYFKVKNLINIFLSFYFLHFSVFHLLKFFHWSRSLVPVILLLQPAEDLGQDMFAVGTTS